ncbi:MAG: glycosyltransferase [Firmicutes bacterium]|nr:glycosyltransferase [Bacillota bacterium]
MRKLIRSILRRVGSDPRSQAEVRPAEERRADAIVGPLPDPSGAQSRPDVRTRGPGDGPKPEAEAGQGAQRPAASSGPVAGVAPADGSSLNAGLEPAAPPSPAAGAEAILAPDGASRIGADIVQRSAPQVESSDLHPSPHSAPASGPEQATWSGPEASIIIPCLDEGELLRSTVDSILETTGDVTYEILVIDDGSGDGSTDFLQGRAYRRVRLLRGPELGPPQARNLGARHASGWLYIFCDAHISVPPHWLTEIMGHFRRDPSVAGLCPGIASTDDPHRVGYGLTWDKELWSIWLHQPSGKLVEVPMLPSGCLALRRDAFERVGGFNQGFRGYGSEDVELSLRLRLFGYNLYCLPGIVVKHKFRKRHPYVVLWEDANYNFLRMVFSHLSEERIAKALLQLSNRISRSDLVGLVARLVADDTLKDRLAWHQQRVHSDDWFIKRFEIPF